MLSPCIGGGLNVHMKLVWNDSEQGWICSNCGSIYSEEEVQRVFGYNYQSSENFDDGYCMDCGCHWTEAEE